MTTDKIVSAARPHKSTIRLVEQRAGIITPFKGAHAITPFKGAHALRHTAATEMLRHGVALEKIGLVLRHRGIDTTAYYAKAGLTPPFQRRCRGESSRWVDQGDRTDAGADR